METVIFEAFESSPPTEDVLAAENALRWDFPSRAAELPLHVFLDEAFHEALAAFLEQASSEQLERFAARAAKANASVTEVRDTTDPALITQMLTSLLEALGNSVHVPTLRKRVRDDVNIQDAELPWRRLPFWLVLRVAMQRQLEFVLGQMTGRACYKFLICTALSQLLEDCAGRITPEMTIILRAKLCRRIAKLETEKTRVASCSSAVYKDLFGSLSPLFKTIIQAGTAKVEAAWNKHKKSTTKVVPKLPPHADEHSLNLSLPDSGKRLENILQSCSELWVSSKARNTPRLSDGMAEEARNFVDSYFKLAQTESDIERRQRLTTSSVATCRTRCLELARSINELFATVGKAYESNTEQLSIFILSLFDMWTEMDKCAVKACPLLREYHPTFSPELLDVLQLPTLAGMRRLATIQSYLKDRCVNCRHGHMNIFSQYNEKNFATTYATNSERLQKLQEEIESASTLERQMRQSAWEKACKDYDNRTQKISESSCVCSRNDDGTRNVRGCTKCWHRRCRKRIKVSAHEDFLPSENVRKSAVVFELGIPSHLLAYRDATWRIVRDLGLPNRPEPSPEPALLLKGYKKLRHYIESTPGRVSLASVKKSFLQTHYKAMKMKVDLKSVLLPQGADFSLYDLESGTWIKNFTDSLTFQHLCGVHIPRALNAAVGQTHWSSYEIIASQTECPPEMSVHEFLAYQSLVSGMTRRWPCVLVELGSSNLNFSSEDTMHVITQLAVQAGPQKGGELLRDTHSIFKEKHFRHRLAEQLDNRLRSIKPSWRETYCMEIIITLALRLFTLTTGEDREPAQRLLKTSRAMTLEWISRLRPELQSATEKDVADRTAMYAFQAALLCRKTFAIYVEPTSSAMNAEDLDAFVRASVALQENLIMDLEKLPPTMKNMFIRDMKMAYSLRKLIRQSIQVHASCFKTALSLALSASDDASHRSVSSWVFLDAPDENWMVSNLNTTVGRSSFNQPVHYNFVEGHLLIDGKPLGKLPLNLRGSEDVKALFGNQHLRTYPSPLTGMTHKLAGTVEGNEVHFGIRENHVIIWALTRGVLREYVPKEVFKQGDLPSSLVENCTHWLNIQSGCLEIRRNPSIWRTRQRDWILDVVKRRASRGSVFLVDPHSDLARRVAEIFHHFEAPERLTVYQPPGGKLMVELRHLELSFFVNKIGLLQCRQLHAEIDPNQDAGTLYGFQSKIVMRDGYNHGRRSIIFPLGPLTWTRQGIHVAVQAHSSNEYGKFEIDSVLGRLTCPPEPRLLYSKALCHAITSFALPDSLTGRTGAEEALSILKSGSSQPWSPLNTAPVDILHVIEALSPRREYYPKDMRRLQTVAWDPHLTFCIQHDCYEPAVQDILGRSIRLESFVSNCEQASDIYVRSHLRKRSEFRRLLYERPPFGETVMAEDEIYPPGDRRKISKQATNVYQIAKLFRASPLRISMKRDLRHIVEAWGETGGFQDTPQPDTYALSDLIQDRVNEQWGSLVNFCRNTDATNPYAAMFRLSLLCFGPKPDIDMIKSLVAIARLDELKVLSTPSHPWYVSFKFRAAPSVEVLQRLVRPAYLEFKPTVKNKKKLLDVARKNHQLQCEAEGRRFAHSVVDQWPCSVPSTEYFESSVIDPDIALESILPEWGSLHRNMELSEYIDQVERILRRHKGPEDMFVPLSPNLGSSGSCSSPQDSIIPSPFRDFVTKAGPPPSALTYPTSKTSTVKDVPLGPSVSRQKQAHSWGATPQRELIELGHIFRRFTESEDDTRRLYGGYLEESLAAQYGAITRTGFDRASSQYSITTEDLAKAQGAMVFRFKQIQSAFCAADSRFQWLQLGNMWPAVTPITILELLRSTAACQFGDGMKEALVSYGILITNLQRLHRIKHAQLKGDERKAQDEQQNPGHENWNPLEFPDWLLLEIDSNLLIRSEQIDVSHAIISPASRSNSVLQMNMGKGKTSCIVPMAVAFLANKRQLSRLIVPKALLLQTAQTIQSRLGGLVGREVRHVPFSRRTPTTPGMIRLYSELHNDLLESCGVMLTTPEHILSYKLSGLQMLADSKLPAAREMIRFQSHLTDMCRDILDESDFSLAVRTQLIYPSGDRVSVDGHPHRWEVAQCLLSLVDDHLRELESMFPSSIKVVRRPQGYPFIHFLRTDVEHALQGLIANDICDGRVSFLRPAGRALPEFRKVLRRMLSGELPDQEEINFLSQHFNDKVSAPKKLLLVRGVLQNEILLLCLKKRWNVQYGLHPNRPPVAVPFEAKGVPSEQSEFGHPDVAIIFTCLSFYYSGLSLAQFRESLLHLLKSTDPAAEYDRWIHLRGGLPEALRHWNVINIEDHGQVEELWRHLRLEKNVLDHHMNNFVFPTHAKQFSVKLQASGWDIPLFSNAHTEGNSIVRTTGFSGTNDNRMMLPMTIQQDDLPSLLHTNAEVLSYLLHDRNRAYRIAAVQGRRRTEEELIQWIAGNKIKIFIDAGAYILGMDNQRLVKYWLEKYPPAPAAVFFGSDNRAWVQYRGGKEKVPLVATPYLQDLSQCLVYIDEAHTRGVDLNLPREAHGVLTLALGQTKDHTVQGKSVPILFGKS